MGKEDNNEMSFLEHLEELRWHIVRSLIAIALVGIFAFVFKQFIFDVIILSPRQPGFFTNRMLCQLGDLIHVQRLCINQYPVQLQSIQMAGQFTTHIMVSLIGGIIFASPYLFYEVWKFLVPALYSHERRHARVAIFYCSFLFFVGVAFGYFVITPLSVNFLTSYQVSNQVVNEINLNSYIRTVASITLASAVVFELPVIVYFLSKIGLVNPAFLRKYRKHALVLILLLSAIITPPDIFSQVLVALPLTVLYEAGIKISARVEKNAGSEND